MDELLGQHQKLVDHLDERLEALCDGDLTLPRVVVLRGPSGVGKSRIVRELYEHLRSRQREPHFWPPLPGGADPVTSDRKLIGPDADGFVWAANALPEFGWWGFKCESNPDIITLAQLLLQRFLPPLSIAAAQQSGIWDRIAAKHSTIRRELAAATADELTGQALEFLQIADPGVGTAVSWIWKTAMAAKHHADRLHDWDSDVDLGSRQEAERRSTAEEVARLIAQLARPALPQVVVFEDGHRMGDHLLSVVDGLAVPRRDRPVLSIITSWPEAQANASTPWAQWLTKNENRVEVVDVPPLDAPDLVRILRDYAPQTGNADAEKLVSTLNSPLLLKLWLTLGATARLINKGDGALIWDDKRFARGLPATLADVYRMRWRELPESVRHALVLAGIATDPNDPLPKFLPQIIVDAAGSDYGSLQQGFDAATDPAAWTIVENAIHSYREILMTTTARSHEFQSDVLDRSESERFISHVRTIIAEKIHAHIDPENRYYLPDQDANPVLADWYIALNSDTSDEAYIAAAWLQGRRLALNHRYAQAIALVEPLAPRGSKTLLHKSIADWYGEQGNSPKALAIYESLQGEFSRVLGPNHSRTLGARLNMAYWRGKTGDTEIALNEYQSLLLSIARIHGPDHPHMLTARHNIVFLYAEAGEIKAALTEAAKLLADRTRILGEEHPSALTTRNCIAHWKGLTGDSQGAFAELKEVLADRIRILGEDHPSVFHTRSCLAYWQEDNRVSLNEFEDLLSDCTRVLGPEHPGTLATRSNVALFRAETGDTHRALSEYEDVLVDQTRIYGSDNPDSLRVRFNIATLKINKSHWRTALNELEDLLDEQIRVLGVDDPDTQRTQEFLGILRPIDSS